MKKDMGLAIVLAGKKRAPDSEADSEPEPEGGDEGKLSAAEDLIAAIKSGDAQAVSDALAAHYEMCG